jgi:hypothetical protein
VSSTLDITRDIVVTAIGQNGIAINKSTSQLVTDFIDSVYNKIKELDDREQQE